MSDIPTDLKKLDVTLPVVKPNFSSPPPASCKLTWIGHSSLLLQAEGVNILTDPHFSERAGPFSFVGPKRYRPCPVNNLKDLPPIHAVLISHNHYDHMDSTSISKLASEFPKANWYLPLGTAAYMPKEVDRPNIHELDWWQDKSLVVGEKIFKMSLVPAQHWTRRWLFDTNKALWGGWVVEGTNGGSFYFAGDSGYCPVFKEIGERFKGFSISAIPVGTFLNLTIGAYEPYWFMRLQHVNRQEAVAMHRDVNSKHSLGIHWGTFKLTTEHYLEPRDLEPFLKSTDKPFVTTDHGNSITVPWK